MIRRSVLRDQEALLARHAAAAASKMARRVPGHLIYGDEFLQGDADAFSSHSSQLIPSAGHE